METIAILLVAYVLILLVFWLSWESIALTPVVKEGALRYSIIIAFRNEAAHLKGLLASLEQMDKGALDYEIIFIDDHSSDEGKQIIENYTANLPIRFERLREATGKKRAIAHGISKATGQIILTTDADSEVSENWLTSTAYFFEKKKAKMVLGLVYYKAENSFERMQQIEFSSLIGSGFASLKLGFATMANGANFSYQKQAYEEVKGFEDNAHIPSGDDEFLLHKVHKKNQVAVYTNKAGFVYTASNKTMSEFFQQRLRWAGKWRYYKHFAPKITAVMVILYQFLWLMAMISIYIYPAIGAILIIKALVESVFLYRVLRLHEKIPIQPHLFLLLQIIYPIYVIVVGMLSIFGKYSWKERNY